MEISLENLVVDIGAESVNTNKLKIHYLTTYHNNALHVISAHIPGGGTAIYGLYRYVPL